MKKKSIAEDCHFQPRYSGDASRSFWNTVNASTNPMLYQFGCALQDLEERVLRVVNADVDMQVELITALRNMETTKKHRRISASRRGAGRRKTHEV